MADAEVRYARTSDDVRIAYSTTSGEGVPVLYLSPPGTMALSVAGLVPGEMDWIHAMRGGRPCITYDARGVGLSGPLGEGLDAATQDADIEAVTREVGVPMDVVAFLSGCFPAARIAATAPTLWRSLTVVMPGLDADLRFARPFLQMQESLPWERLVEAVLRQFWDLHGAESEKTARRLAEAVSRRSFDAHMAVHKTVDIRLLLPKIEIPTLVIAHESMQGPSAAFAELLPNCSIGLTSFRYRDGAYGADIGRQVQALINRTFGETTTDGSTELTAPGEATKAILSSREAEIMRLIAAGRTNREIAESLVISVRTVERHVANIYGKIGVNNRAEAAAWAVKNGLA